jgi:membrane fusion protein (multidrug efflux system)
VFPNPERLLVDGQFVNVLVERERPEPSLVVPQTALQVDQAGTFVLVVNDKHEVEVRRVTVSATANRDAIIATGLKGGEAVIVQGIQKVRPGQVVESVPAAAAAAGA